MTTPTTTTAVLSIPTPAEVFDYLSTQQEQKKAREEYDYQKMRTTVIQLL